MVNSEDYILLSYKNPNGKDTTKNFFNITSDIFKDAVENSLFYAFLSLPFTNANISVGAQGVGLSINKRIENIVKGRLAEEILIRYLKKDSPIQKKWGLEKYIEEYPEQTAYWLNDYCDSVKKDKKGRILTDVDIKTINLRIDIENIPTIDELHSTKLVRSSRAPKTNNHEISRPLAVLLEEPWRHFNKLLTQKISSRSNKIIGRPLEVLFAVCPKFNIYGNDFNDFTELYLKYYDFWSKNKNGNLTKGRKNFPGDLDLSKIEEKLKNYIHNPKTYPDSLKWVIKNWKKIYDTIIDIVSKTTKKLEGYWIWISGFANQESAEKFENIYQNDHIVLGNSNIWSSAGRSPHEKRWTSYKNGRIKNRPIIDENHPDLYLNNHTIDIESDFIYSVKTHLK